MPSKSSRTWSKPREKGRAEGDHTSKSKSPWPKFNDRDHAAQPLGGSAEAQHRLKSSGSQLQPSASASKALVPYTGDLKPIWGSIRPEIVNPLITTVAVVGRDQLKPMMELMTTKVEKYGKRMRCRVIITTPEKPQRQLDRVADIERHRDGDREGATTLQIFAASTVDCITYHISKVMRKVLVSPCVPGKFGELRIGSSSTYCGFRTYAWDTGSRPARFSDPHRYRITHDASCHWNVCDDLDMARQLFVPLPVPEADMTAGLDMAQLEEDSMNLREHMRVGAAPGPSADASQAPGPSEGWLKPWKAILSTIIGGLGGAAFANLGGLFWFTSTGIAIKGPLGLSLSMGHTSCLFAGGLSAGGAATAGVVLAGAALVYFIPWERVFDIFQKLLSKIWDLIAGTMTWVWEKLKGLAASFIEWVTW